MTKIDQKSLIPDLKLARVKNRSSLGTAEIFLDEKTSVKTVGMVYGIEHDISGDGFSAKLFLDHYNQRIRIKSYEGPNLSGLILKIRTIATANQFDKIFCMALRRDWQAFLAHGYVLEAVLKYYRRGEDAFVVSKFRSQERLTSPCLMEEILLIEDILSRPPRQLEPTVSTGFEIRFARKEDIPELTQLYRTIFESYPSPLVYAEYLEHILHADSLIMVCHQGERIVAAASAELSPVHLAAELTDCATLPEFRGMNLMSHLLKRLEEEISKRKYVCSFTMARARSFGMNNVFHQLGYEFQGRMLNNCDIYGAYEDMNIWVKDLREGAGGPC